MKNIGVKVLIGLCIILLIAVIIEAFIIKNKSEELENNAAIISAKDERISKLEQSEKRLNKRSDELSSRLEFYQESAKEKRLKNMHPIEREVYDCMEKANNHSEILNCMYNSEGKWEKEMQKELTELKKNLSSEEYAILLTSQKNWEQYRKSQIKLIVNICSKAKGTIFQDYASSEIVSIIEKRAKFMYWLSDISKDR